MYLGTSIIITLAFISALFSVFILLLRKKSKCIFGIYPKKGIFYHIKYPLALIVLRYWRKRIFDQHEEELNSTEYLESLDNPQVLSSNPESYDVVSFVGADKEGRKFMITMERRRRGIIRAALYIWIPKKGLFLSPNLPDMVHFTTDGETESEEFKAEGFHIYPKECMKKWRITYNGDLKQGTKRFPCKFEGEFTSELKHFNYNRDLSSKVIADSVAREAWNDQFFYMVKNVDKFLLNRTHYEQSGILSGSFKLGDDLKKSFSLSAIRDHSFGTERCLSSIYRYVYFAIFLDDGTNLVVGILSQPSYYFSTLKIGYVCDPVKGYTPISSCNFELYSYGEKGTPPNHENFIVETSERRYFVQIKSEDSAIRFVGGNWEAKVYDQFISCTVNGVSGHGVSEYLYRNKTGRSDIVSQNDPEWYKKIKSFERSLSKNEQDEDWSGFSWF